jgi:hypothetical protein
MHEHFNLLSTDDCQLKNLLFTREEAKLDLIFLFSFLGHERESNG